jgi:formamidopyrimidine-DNA glycosylase
VRRHPDPAELHARLAGRTITGLGRHGKYLLLRTDGGEVAVLHLGMSGQVRVEPGGSLRPRHTHVAMALDDGRELRFVDPRTFGEVFVSAGPEGPDGRPEELAHLGFDPLEERVGPARFGALLAARRMQLKPLLMGQRLVAGIGNIYSDEILWSAALRPDRVASGLSPAEAGVLRRRMLAVLRAAVRAGGSTLGDQSYLDVYGAPGRYQLRHRAYGREGRPCARCGARIARVRWGGRSTFFCPACQR